AFPVTTLFRSLEGCELVVTLEPCAMCAAAAQASRVSSVVLGAWEPKTGACGSLVDVLRAPGALFVPEVRAGVLEAECQEVLRRFFFFFQAEDGIRDRNVTGVQTCALPISTGTADYPVGHGIAPKIHTLPLPVSLLAIQRNSVLELLLHHIGHRGGGCHAFL